MSPDTPLVSDQQRQARDASRKVRGAQPRVFLIQQAGCGTGPLPTRAPTEYPRWEAGWGSGPVPSGSALLNRNQAGGSAIIAVNCASAATAPSSIARPANLQTLARFCTNSASSRSSTPGSTGFLNLAPSIAMK